MDIPTDYLKEIGKKGGEATKKNQGKDYYKQLQRKSVEKRRQNKIKAKNGII